MQVKSKKRVAEHGEVFTAEREVKAMCDLVAEECEKIDSTFLEPACGEGNFLIEILSRKLNTVKKNYSENNSEYERNSLIALSTLYGIDILEDNVKICREKLFDLWDNENFSDELRKSARKILELNIICGDTLKGKNIIICEWNFFDDKIHVQRQDFSLHSLAGEPLEFSDEDIKEKNKNYNPKEYWKIYEYE